MSFSPDQLDSSLNVELGRRRWVVGLSGGLDSVALLHATSQYLADQTLTGQALADKNRPPQLIALHVNHQLSQNADAWQEHCRSLCEQWGVEFVAQTVAVVDTGKGSLEDAARRARYQVFESFLEETDVLLLAHHLDDQAETLLHRMLRGSGVKGLAGMPTRRVLGKAELVRPFLKFTRKELEAFASSQGLEWIDDESNSDQSLDRNFLRHEIIPRLESRWPALRHAFQRSAEHHSEAAKLLEELGREDISEAASHDDYGHCVLQLDMLQNLFNSRLKNALRTWWQDNGFSVPSTRQLDVIINEVVNAREDAKPEMVCAEWELRRYQGALYLMPPLPAHDIQSVIPVSGFGDYTLAGAGLLRVKKMVGQGLRILDDSEIRFRQGGETLRLIGKKETKSLKKLLQEHNVPPWLRDRLPLLYQAGQLVAVPGLGVAERFQCDADEIGQEVIWEFSVAKVNSLS